MIAKASHGRTQASSRRLFVRECARQIDDDSHAMQTTVRSEERTPLGERSCRNGASSLSYRPRRRSEFICASDLTQASPGAVRYSAGMAGRRSQNEITMGRRGGAAQQFGGSLCVPGTGGHLRLRAEPDCKHVRPSPV